jgi:hypothetical protein
MAYVSGDGFCTPAIPNMSMLVPKCKILLSGNARNSFLINHLGFR